MNITGYDPRYRDDLARLWLDSWRSTGVETGETITAEGLATRVEAEISGGWRVWLAWRDGELAAFMALLPGRLDQLFVAPAAQGSGVGAALLDIAKREEPDGLRLRAAAANVRARRFYEARGFRLGEAGPHPRLGYATATYFWP